MRGDGIGADSCWIRAGRDNRNLIVVFVVRIFDHSVMLATSQECYFDSDSIGVRATFRFGQKIADPARVVKLTVATPGS